jgi:WD40 repeat protein
MNLAMQAWRAGDVARVLELLEGQRPSRVEDDLRGFEWYYLWRLCHAGSRHLVGHTDAVLCVSYSPAPVPDGKALASAGSDGTGRLWDVATGRERMVLQGHTSPPWDVAFSPDGTVLASGGKTNKEIILWNATTGRPIHTIPASVSGLAFSPGGRTLLGGGLSTRLWDVDKGTQRATFAEPGLMLGMLPDRKTVVTLANQYLENAEFRFWDAESGARRSTIPLANSFVAAVSPGGAWVASATWLYVSVWDAATGKLLSTYRTAVSTIRGLAFSPDGKRLAVGSSGI